jgi:hypothetical protein
VVRLLATEEAMLTPTLVRFSIDGMNGLTWALMAAFDSNSLKLQTLSLSRSGQWGQKSTEVVPAIQKGCATN